MTSTDSEQTDVCRSEMPRYRFSRMASNGGIQRISGFLSVLVKPPPSLSEASVALVAAALRLREIARRQRLDLPCQIAPASRSVGTESRRDQVTSERSPPRVWSAGIAPRRERATGGRGHDLRQSLGRHWPERRLSPSLSDGPGASACQKGASLARTQPVFGSASNRSGYPHYGRGESYGAT
jgi:hypothetical protein